LPERDADDWVYNYQTLNPNTTSYTDDFNTNGNLLNYYTSQFSYYLRACGDDGCDWTSSYANHSPFADFPHKF